MQISYNVRKIDYRNRLRNLDVQAQSNLKSDKFFPVFYIDGKEKIYLLRGEKLESYVTKEEGKESYQERSRVK